MITKGNEDYERGFSQGVIEGRVQERVAREKSDGCTSCAFCMTEEWEMPCSKCRRNCKDYWRSKPDD